MVDDVSPWSWILNGYWFIWQVMDIFSHQNLLKCLKIPWTIVVAMFLPIFANVSWVRSFWRSPTSSASQFPSIACIFVCSKRASLRASAWRSWPSYDLLNKNLPVFPLDIFELKNSTVCCKPGERTPVACPSMLAPFAVADLDNRNKYMNILPTTHVHYKPKASRRYIAPNQSFWP